MAARRKTALTEEQAKQQKLANDARERFNQRKSWFVMELRRQEANRYQMALDEDYYDNEQWTQAEAAAIRARGQNPVVHNEIKPTCDWLIGTERRMRRDFRVIARGNNSPDAANDADIKTQLLKYLDDVNRTPFERSEAAKEQFCAGLGWLEIGIRREGSEEPIYQRYESWRNILHDSLARPDLTDARYLFRFREVDLDIAIGWFNNKASELQKAAMAGDDEGTGPWSGGYPISGYGGTVGMDRKFVSFDPSSWAFNPRRRVLLIECWSREMDPETGQMRMRLSIMTEFDTIEEEWSPYNHERFPFVPLWCYRRKKDGQPYGVIRALRGPQDSLNKRMSKAEFLLSVNQLRLDSDAIDEEVMTLDEIREENAAPDGTLVFAKGAIAGNKVQTREHLDIAQGHLVMADRNAASIRSVSGVTQESRGMDGGSQSGRAVIAKQEQGSMVTTEIFDNQLMGHQLEGEICISLIEQYYTDHKIFSITGERYKIDYFEINQMDPSGKKLNDVTRFKATFIIGDQPWKQALAQAAFEQTLNMMGQLATVAPNVVLAILDLVFEWADVPNKQQMLQRIRQATGQRDPDKDPTPEEQAAMAQQAELQKMQQDLEMASLRAQVKKAIADGDLAEAKVLSTRVDTMLKSIQGGQSLASFPAAAASADQILVSVGFQDMAGQPVLDGQPDQPAAPAPVQPNPAAQGAARPVVSMQEAQGAFQ